ncbi:MAG: TetR/AcrR family transcriptional regulator [Bacteroidales bacterium]|nr:TetR/AcrR family transcriptional regulator [Bacteroidales bacterium]
MENEKGNISTTEQQILEAAKSVFLEKGMDGARMQEIADRAGINKALLHYYFRTKDKLFITIFRNLISNLFEQINLQLQNNDDIFDFVEKFVTNYIAMLEHNVYLPNFIMNEMNRNHENIVQIFESERVIQNVPKLEKIIKKSVEAGEIIPITAENLITDMIGLCVFPVVGKPVILNFLFRGDIAAHKKFMEGRKEHVINLIKNSLTPGKQIK